MTPHRGIVPLQVHSPDGRPCYLLPLGEKPPLNLNQRLHWATKAKKVAAVRGMVVLRCRELRIPAADHVTVELHYVPRDRRVRDADNLIATLKPAIDGVVQAGIIPDDDPTHVTWRPPIIHPPDGHPRYWLEVTPDAQEDT